MRQKDHSQGLPNPKPGHGLKKLVLSSNIHSTPFHLKGLWWNLGTSDLSSFFYISNHFKPVQSDHPV